MKQPTKERIGRFKRTLVKAFCIVVTVVFVVMPVFSVIVYNDCFGKRFETDEKTAHSVDEYPGLQVEECTFPSDRGQLLAGYQYSKAGQETVKGVVVLAHGLGGGQNGYMDVANRFVSGGYLVFAYDATGNDKSEGKSIRGLPQGIVDLDYALRYVKQAEVYKGLPIALFGHSWGGYAVGNVLNRHTDVKAAVMVAGFDKSGDLIKAQGSVMIGPFISLFMPYVSLYERLRFGEYASFTAMDGFAGTEAGIMIVHSRDDKEVPIQYGYDKFYAVYGDNPRFRFVEYTDRGHSIRMDAALLEEMLAFYDAYC